MDKYSQEWMEEWQQKVNNDPVFRVIGKFIDCDIEFGFGENRYVVKMDNGKMKEIVSLAEREEKSHFALKASIEPWDKFTQVIPPPKFNDIWAMAHPLHQNLVIEGDSKVFWQNVRALTWMLDLMKEV